MLFASDIIIKGRRGHRLPKGGRSYRRNSTVRERTS